MKKKALSLLMATSMVTAMIVGCGSDAGSSSGDTTAVGSDTSGSGEIPAGKVYNIGICQLLEHPALDEATRGFEEALIELMGEEHVNFDFQNAQGEQPNCATITTQFVTDGVDLIMANATPPLQAAAAATNTIPILGTSITDYATALDVADWTGASGTNISGTSDLAPIDEQENMLVELFPDAKKVGILYCSAEANSKYQADMFKAALEQDSIAYEEFTVADSNEIQSVVTSAVESCDVLYIPTDNTLAGSTELINNIALPAGVPIIASEEGICAGCGVATLSISYYELGYTTGILAYEILVGGADISKMQIMYAPNVTKMYNPVICEQLGVEIPDNYVAIAAE